MSKKRNKKTKQNASQMKIHKTIQKDKPKIKDLIIHSGILYVIFVIGYLILCSIQSLIAHRELGHFYVLGRRSSAIEITDNPLLIIGYFIVLLFICVLPNLLLYVREMQEYNKSNSSK